MLVLRKESAAEEASNFICTATIGHPAKIAYNINNTYRLQSLAVFLRDQSTPSLPTADPSSDRRLSLDRAHLLHCRSSAGRCRQWCRTSEPAPGSEVTQFVEASNPVSVSNSMPTSFWNPLSMDIFSSVNCLNGSRSTQPAEIAKALLRRPSYPGNPSVQHCGLVYKRSRCESFLGHVFQLTKCGCAASFVNSCAFLPSSRQVTDGVQAKSTVVHTHQQLYCTCPAFLALHRDFAASSSVELRLFRWIPSENKCDMLLYLVYRIFAEKKRRLPTRPNPKSHGLSELRVGRFATCACKAMTFNEAL